MKDVKTLFEDALKKNRERGYSTLYIAIDVHGTIFYPSKKTEMLMCDGSTTPSEQVFNIGVKTEYGFYKDALKCLEMLSARADVKIILWTSALDTYHLLKTLKWNGVKIEYLNDNPDFKCNEYADFSKKFYFDVLLDDKAGFEPETDWTKIMEVDFDKFCKNIGESENERSAR